MNQFSLDSTLGPCILCIESFVLDTRPCFLSQPTEKEVNSLLSSLVPHVKAGDCNTVPSLP